MRFYFDEDSAEKALVEALRARGVDVSVPSEAGLLEADDSDQLQWCIRNQRVLITCNIDDFCHLHSELLRQNQSHFGIIAVQQQSLGIGERIASHHKTLRGLERRRDGQSNRISECLELNRSSGRVLGG